MRGPRFQAFAGTVIPAPGRQPVMDHLECYRCGAEAAVDAAEPFDFLMERLEWPQIPCESTPGCEGWLEPQALN